MPSPSPSGNGTGCTATYAVTNSWPGGYQASVVVTNNAFTAMSGSP